MATSFSIHLEKLQSEIKHRVKPRVTQKRTPTKVWRTSGYIFLFFYIETIHSVVVLLLHLRELDLWDELSVSINGQGDNMVL